MKSTDICFAVFVGILFALFWLTPVAATTYFVDQRHPAASDDNAGISENFPWLTLNRATNSVVAGDSVIVKTGLYIDSNANTNSMSAFQVAHSGSATSPIVFKSEPIGAAVIGRNVAGAPAWGIENRNYITLDGFKALGAIGFRNGSHNTIRNCEVINGSILWGDISLHWGIYLQKSNNGLIENNYVHDMDSSGNNSHNTACIMLFGNSHDSIIKNNSVDGNNKTIYNGYGTKAGGMDRSTWYYNVAKNCVTGFMGMGSTSGDVSVYDLIIYQNIIINCTWGIELYKNTDRTEFYNNTLYGVERFITVEDATCNNFKVWNNIINASTYGLIRFAGYKGSNNFSDLFDYSDFNNFTGDYSVFAYRESNRLLYSTLSSWQAGENFDNSSVVTDPYFINPGGMNPEDYKRTSYSMVGRGTPYAFVMGAYLTGNEKIGYSFDDFIPKDLKNN